MRGFFPCWDITDLDLIFLMVIWLPISLRFPRLVRFCVFLLCFYSGWDFWLSSFVSDFADWVEFSPYEIGMAKYGTFMSPDLFGSKFFMGTVVKKYAENPLHFLMGECVTERSLKIKAISVVHGLLNAVTQSVRQEVELSVCWKTLIWKISQVWIGIVYLFLVSIGWFWVGHLSLWLGLLQTQRCVQRAAKCLLRYVEFIFFLPSTIHYLFFLFQVSGAVHFQYYLTESLVSPILRMKDPPWKKN